jgi:hypothetical protein
VGGEKMKRYEVKYKEFEGTKFYYIDVGSGTHGKISFRLWISSKLVQRDEEGSLFIESPLNAQIVKTEKGNYVAKPGPGVIYDVFVDCGYRGGAEFTIDDPEILQLGYVAYRSPVGSLGVSRGALVYVPSGKPIIVRWKRTGRLYGSPAKGITKYYPDGTVEELDDADDVSDLKSALE